MADGSIKIDISVNGKEVKAASKNIESLGQGSQKATKSIKDMALSFGLVKVASAAFNVLKNSLDGAIARFDTMQKFPKVMDSLGFSAIESERSINKLANGIEGLPTKLNDVVSQTQQLASITGDLDKSTDTVLALNNAFLASGASADDASRGMVQFNQMLANGKVDMQSWKSLTETMSPSLRKVADAMGFVGDAAVNDLYSALKSGDVTFDQFNAKLIELGTGTGELAELAKTNSKGIATSFSNLRNASVKGLANMLDALDEVSKATTGSTIAENIDKMKVMINKSFDSINKSIRRSEPLFKVFADTVAFATKHGDLLINTLSGISAGYVTFTAIKTANKAIEDTAKYFSMARESGKDLTLVMKTVATAQELSTGATKADILARMAQNGEISLGTSLIGLLTGQTTVSTAATVAKTTAVTALKGAYTLLMGPVGWITASVGVLTYLLRENSKETKKATENAKKQAEEYRTLNDAIVSNRIEREKSIKKIDSEKAVTGSLIDSLDDLYSKEKLTQAQKTELLDVVDQLNSKYADLNLVYDEETGYLNQSIGLIKEKTTAYEAQAKVAAYNESINENLKEQIQLESQSKTLKEDIAELEEKIMAGRYDGRRADIILQEEQQAVYEETMERLRKNEAEFIDLQDGRKVAIEGVTAAEQSASEAIQAANANTALSYDMLQEAGQKAMDTLQDKYNALKDTAVNAYDVIDEKSEISVAKMAENMAENQRIIGEWATNIDELAKRGLDEGILEQLRQAGPESAAQVNALVNASDEEFQRFNEVAGNAGDTAVTALKTAFDLGSHDIPDSVMTLVTAAKETLDDQLNAANFSQYGQDIADGFAQGAEQGSEKVGGASQKLADEVDKRFRAPLGINSPSRLFIQFGGYIIDGLVNGINNGSGRVQSAIAKIVTTMKNEMNKIRTDSSNVMNGYVGNLTNSMNRANSIVQANANRMRATFTTFNQQLTAQSTSGMNRYTQTIVSGMNRSSQAVTQGNNRMRTQFSSLRTMMVSSARQAMESYVNTFQSGSNRAVSTVSNSRIRMANTMSSLRSSFYNSGVNASYGLASGIYAGSGSAIAAARSVANQVAATMRSALKIKSPSRVMRDEIGRYIPEGLAVGIDKYADKAYEAMGRLSNGLMNPIAPEFASGAYNIGSTGVMSSVSNITKTIENSPQVTMNVTWKGKEDIRRTMETMGWLVNVDEKGAMA